MQFFHNYNVFGSCIIHILYTECAKIKKKKVNPRNVPKFFADFSCNTLYVHSTKGQIVGPEDRLSSLTSFPRYF